MTGQPEMSPVVATSEASGRSRRVFVSYANDSEQHREDVLAFAEGLRDQGFDVFLDQWNKRSRIDWNQTVTNEIKSADFVLAVVSPSYKAAAEGESPASSNLGAQHELTIIRELLNSGRSVWLPKIIPVILPGYTIDDVPLFLQPTSANHCQVDEFSASGLAELLELLTAKANGTRTGVTPWRRLPFRASAVQPGIMGLLFSRWTLAGAALATVATIIGVAVACGQDSGNSGQAASASGTGNSINQNSGTCGQVSNNSTCVVQLQQAVQDAGDSSTDDTEFKARLAKDAREHPTDFGPGPWPFVVVDTFVNGKDLGLFARNTNRINSDRIGTAANRTTIWADCVAVSDFTPPGTTEENVVGPRWLRVHWKSVPPQARSISEPSEPQRAWMYLGDTVPLKHDGNIPACPTS